MKVTQLLGKRYRTLVSIAKVFTRASYIQTLGSQEEKIAEILVKDGILKRVGQKYELVRTE